MNSAPNSYPPYQGNFDEERGLQWMTDDGAYQHTSISGLIASSQLEPDQIWVSQQLEDLIAVTTHIDAKLQELQVLYQKKQDALARLRAFNATSATSTWSVPPQPTTSTSPLTAPHAPTVIHLPPEYMVHNHTGKMAFDFKTSRKEEVTWHRGALKHAKHAKKRHICQNCGKGYTRKDSLLRHVAIHTFEFPYL